MLLELENIFKNYQHPSGTGKIGVLKGITLQVEQGDSMAVVGPSGSGKTTLLNIIGGLEPSTSGSVKFAEKDLALLDDAQLSEMRNLDVGFVFQLHHLLPQCTVLENVLIPTIPVGSKQEKNEPLHRAQQLLERVGLQDHLDHFPAQLSGGELQRAAFVRALINRPKLILADEPTGSLDKDFSQALGQLLVGLNREEGTALIVVTHSDEIARLMDKVYHLQNGKLEKEK